MSESNRGGHDGELPPIEMDTNMNMDLDTTHRRSSSFLGSIFGGANIERRPLPIMLVIFGIIFLGFVVGTLFTMGILSGLIEINPKAIKTILKTLMGKA